MQSTPYRTVTQPVRCTARLACHQGGYDTWLPTVLSTERHSAQAAGSATHFGHRRTFLASAVGSMALVLTDTNC
jgi:hypothetical protein